jgi:hypothetical protein
MADRENGISTTLSERKDSKDILSFIVDSISSKQFLSCEQVNFYFISLLSSGSFSLSLYPAIDTLAN